MTWVRPVAQERAEAWARRRSVRAANARQLEAPEPNQWFASPYMGWFAIYRFVPVGGYRRGRRSAVHYGFAPSLAAVDKFVRDYVRLHE